MVKPISPQEVVKVLPGFVIESVNELIQERYQKNGFTILQKDIVERIKSKIDDGIDFDNEWLNFEPLYRDWKITYDKPGYCETYDASFAFREA